jgi:hypothetical protein
VSPLTATYLVWSRRTGKRLARLHGAS